MKNVLPLKTGYFDNGVNDLSGVVTRARKHLHGVEYDTLVGTGFSGSVVVPTLARALRKNFVLIRKEGVSSHHSGKALGNLGERWIFVDDFISSGATKARVARVIKSLTTAVGRYDDDFDWVEDDFETVHVGDYLYERWNPLTETDERGIFDACDPKTDYCPQGARYETYQG